MLRSPLLVAGLGLVLVWGAALALLLGGRMEPALPLMAVPLAGFAAGWWPGRAWARAGDGPRIARWTVGVIAAGVAVGVWALVDPDRWRAFLVFGAMLATVPALVTGLLAGAWTGAQARP